jgi:hypothetical protein
MNVEDKYIKISTNFKFSRDPAVLDSHLSCYCLNSSSRQTEELTWLGTDGTALLTTPLTN